MTFRGVISRDDWGAAPPSSYAGVQALDAGLVIHWEGPALGWPREHDRCYELVRGIQAYHQRVGYSDIAYNDVACPHGYLFSARAGVPMANAANGTNYDNAHAYAICCLIGLGDDGAVTEDLKDAILAARNFWAQYGLSAQVRDHRDVVGVSTFCPGDELDAWTDTVDGSPFVGVPVDPGTGVPPVTPPPPDPGFPAWPGRLLSIGSSGQDVGVWQGRMAERGWVIDVDGVFGPQTDGVVRAFQSEKGLGVDGVIGPITWDAAWTAPIT